LLKVRLIRSIRGAKIKSQEPRDKNQDRKGRSFRNMLFFVNIDWMNKRVKDPHFRVLYETDQLILGHEFEYAYLIWKKGKKEIYMGGFYGDPSCGLISENNDWCLVAGDTSVVWRNDGTILPIEDNDLRWIIQLRQTAPYEAELLIDPYSEKAAVWKLDIKTLKFDRLRDFKIDGEYSDKFDW